MGSRAFSWARLRTGLALALLCACAGTFASGAWTNRHAATAGHPTAVHGDGRVAAHTRAGGRLPEVARELVSRVVGASDRGFFVDRSHGALSVTAGGVAAHFTPAGALVHTGGVVWRLATLGGSAAPTVAANRVTYGAGPLREWFAGGPLGLEQGFTLERHPSGGPAVSLPVGRLPAGVSVSLSPSARDAALVRGGRVVVRYTGLVARDSRGGALPASIRRAGDQLVIDVDLRGARYPVTVDPLVSQGTLTTGDSGAGIGDGALAISGNTIVAGARDYFNHDGAVYVFVEPTTGWKNLTTYTARLTNANTTSDNLGKSVAIDGSTIVAGASGYADVFVKAGTIWATTTAPTAKLTDSSISGDTGLGGAVAVSGSTIAVGDGSTGGLDGLIDVFVEPGAAWNSSGPSITTPNAKLTDSTTFMGAGVQGQLGASVAISGGVIVGGAPIWRPTTSDPEAGAALVFTEPVSGWGAAGAARRQNQAAILTPASSSFKSGGAPNLGTSVAIDSGTIVAGAPQWESPTGSQRTGAAYVFTETGSVWMSANQNVLTASDGTLNAQLGAFVGVSGSTVVAGAPFQLASNAGAAYVYRKPTAGWANATQSQELNVTGTHTEFGNAVAISGQTIAASVDPGGNGAVELFGDPSLSITTGSLPSAKQSQTYSAALAGSGGTTPYAWSATGLPGGLSINASTGAISGKPTTAGSYSPTITLTDAYGQSVSKKLTLAVAAGLSNVTPPVVAGTQAAEQTFSCQPGTWSEPATFTYQWFALERPSPATASLKLKSRAKVFGLTGSKKSLGKRFASPVPPKVSVLLAAGQTYHVGFLDSTLDLYCAVAATAPGAGPVIADAAIVPIQPGPPELAKPTRHDPRPARPKIDPGVGVGGTNECTAGDWLGNPKFSYDWYAVANAGGKKLTHLGSAQSLHLDGNEENRLIQCLVTAKNAGGTASAWSNAYKVPQSAPMSTSPPQVSIATQDPSGRALAGAAGGGGIAQIIDLTCGSGGWNRTDLKFSPEWVVLNENYASTPQPGASLHFDMRPGHLQYHFTIQCIVSATTSHGLSSTVKSGPIDVWNGCDEWYADVLQAGTIDAHIGGPERWLYATSPDQLFDYDEADGNQFNGVFGLAGADVAITGPNGHYEGPSRAETDGPNCLGYGEYLDGQGYSVKQGPNPDGDMFWIEHGNPFF
jgi:hypothetical protein